MNNLLKLSILIFLQIYSFTISAQQKKIDSLKISLSNKIEDSSFIKTSILLSTYYYEIKPDSSIFYLDLAIGKGRINNKNEVYLANQLLNYSFFAKNQSKFILSLSFITEAIPIFEKNNSTKKIIKSYSEAGIIYTRLADYNSAIKMLFKALDYTHQLDSFQITLDIINNIGNVYYYKAEYETAIDYYTQITDIISNNTDTVNISNNTIASSLANSYNNIGACYYFQQKYEESLKNYLKSLDINKKINDFQGEMICYSNIAEIYLIQERFDLCFKNYLKALSMAQIDDDKYFIALFNNDLGTVFNTKNETDSAIKYFTIAYELGKTIGAQRITQESSYKLSEIYKSLEHFDKAFYFLSTSKQINDSILNIKQIQQFTKLEMQYEFEQTQKIKELEAQTILNKQKMVRNLFIFTTIFIFLLAISSYISYLKKSKLNIKLKTRNTQINIQNEEIKAQAESLEKANIKITIQKNQIEKSHKNTKDSINYASKIQHALLPMKATFNSIFLEHFIFYKPRDIVSGDFYYLKKTKQNIILVAADCTGHGVPGAFVSMLGIAFLNEITEKKQNLNAGQILDILRENVKKSLKQTGDINDTTDGMDMALCVINHSKTQAQFAGANNPLLIINNNNELTEYKADRQPVSIFIKEKSFKNNLIDLKNGDKLYLFSDGYIDQFNNEKTKKFMMKNFRNMLLKTSKLSMDKQLTEIEKTFFNWKGNCKQLDDILIIGVKI